jgi:hypothetical protein
MMCSSIPRPDQHGGAGHQLPQAVSCTLPATTTRVCHKKLLVSSGPRARSLLGPVSQNMQILACVDLVLSNELSALGQSSVLSPKGAGMNLVELACVACCECAAKH